MAKNKHISILMGRIPINTGSFAFRPISVIKGNYSEEDDIFEDEYGTAYYSITNAEMIGFDIDEIHCFCGHFTDYQLKKRFNSNSKAECIQLLFDEALDNIWLGTITEDNLEKIQILRLPINEIKSNISIPTETSEEEYAENDIFSYLTLTEQEMASLLKMNDIKELKTVLNDINEKYIKQKNIIFNEMGMGNKLKETPIDNSEPKTADKNIATNHNQLSTNKLYKEINIAEMYKYITERVIGQDDAVKQILTSFIMSKIEVSEEEAVEQEITRMFITGPTGSGKTLIIEVMLEYLSKKHKLQLPYVKAPTSQLTASGYIGMDLEDILESLVKNTKGEFPSIEDKIKYAERNGIVYLDELDKKGSNNNGDISGRSVLNALLEFLTGSDYDIALGGDRKVHRTNIYKFNTKYLTIIASGAFTNVFENSNKEIIGFRQSKDNDIVKPKITPKHFVTEGSMPKELIGRFHRFISVNPLSIETLKKIMTTSKNSTLLATKAKLKIIGLDLNCEESFINLVAERAYKSGFGARNLKSIIEESLQEIEWEALNQTKQSIITVTADTVDNPKQYIIEKHGEWE